MCIFVEATDDASILANPNLLFCNFSRLTGAVAVALSGISSESSLVGPCFSLETAYPLLRTFTPISTPLGVSSSVIFSFLTQI